MHSDNAYSRYFRLLRDKPSGFSEVVGGEYENMGYLQLCLLRFAGLKKDQLLVDIGCGTGRLAFQLNQWGLKQYWGYDIVQEMLDVAAERINQPEYFFELIENESIGIPADTVDYLCFFSVFTHIPHHISYRYLLDGLRVLKPGGRLVFSFLSYDYRYHVPFFEHMVGSPNSEPTIQLFSQSQIPLWSKWLDARMVGVYDGTPFFPIDRPVKLDGGVELHNKGALGQSVCIWEKPEAWHPDFGHGL